MLGPIRIVFRTKEAVELYTLPDTSTLAIAASTTNNDSNNKNKKGGRVLYTGATNFHLLNPGGTRAYIHDADIGIVECNLDDVIDVKVDAAGKTIPFLEGSKAVQLAKCSPRGSFLLTWERPITTGNDSADHVVGNLKVWDAANGKLIRGFNCKKATLNTVQWTHDESLLFHLVTNEIHVYDTATTSNSSSGSRVGRIVCKSITSFSLPTVLGISSSNAAVVTNTSLSSGRKYLLTTFITGAKGKPARINLLRYPDRLGRESSTTTSNNPVAIASGSSLASKSLFDAEECTVLWSPRADAALVQTSTTIDATGESYYGSSHLFLLAEDDAKRSGNGCANAVSLPKESSKTSSGIIPIVHAAWMPNPTIAGPIPFGIISGTMPSLSSLHHGVTGEPIFLLGRAHRNTMDISPHGRFVVCGGYGNLAGGMDFWDRNKCKRISRRVILPTSIEEEEKNTTATTPTATNYVTMKDGTKFDLGITSSRPVVGHAWSPDSRTYVVSTTSPRMNVDNGVTVYRYDGSVLPESMVPWDNAKYRPDKLLCVEYVPGPFPTAEGGGGGGGGGGGKEFYYYPDRPQSPPPKGMIELKGDVAENALTNLLRQNVNGINGSAINGNAVPVAPAAYVPPAARGTSTSGGGGAYKPPGARGDGRGGGGGGTSLAERMRKEREGSAANVSGVKVVQRTGQLVGASSVMSATTNNASTEAEKSKSAIRREKQRLAKEKAEREAAELEQQKIDEEKARILANKTDPEKRGKKIVKLLKQIDDIKVKLSNGDELNDDQKKKMESEEELRKELASVGINDTL